MCVCYLHTCIHIYGLKNYKSSYNHPSKTLIALRLIKASLEDNVQMNKITSFYNLNKSQVLFTQDSYLYYRCFNLSFSICKDSINFATLI